MLPRFAAAALLAVAVHGCPTYEYEHEFWLRVDGSGTVHVTGRPGLLTAFKGVGSAEDPAGTVTEKAVRELFEGSGLEVEEVNLVHRDGRPYIFVSAEFDDVSRLSYTPAFPDLRVALVKNGDRLELEGSWQRPLDAKPAGEDVREGLMAVRFHLPSRVYAHQNADLGVERGNILSWRQEVGAGLDGSRLEFGAVMDDRSILLSTVLLFGGAVALAVVLLAFGLWALVHRGRRELERTA